MRRVRFAGVLAILGTCSLAAGALAEEAPDPLAAIEDLGRICAEAPVSVACDLARAQSAAFMAMVVAEAGNTRDRGAFIDLLRAVLTDPNPEIRTSAAYALAKLGPDGTDTPAIQVLLRDPVSNVRAGAWAAAAASSDPAAQAVAKRISERPDSTGYGADPAPFDPAMLGLGLPPGADFLWLSAARRESGQLQFLTDGPVDLTAAYFAETAKRAAQPLDVARAAMPEAASALGDFAATDLFGDPQVVVLNTPTADLPARFAVIYRDLVFGQTGLAIVYADFRNLTPPMVAPALAAPAKAVPEDAPAFEAALIAASGLKPQADAEESDLFLSILAAYGYGAEGYLEVYPDGAYTAEARAILAGPRLVLDRLSYVDGADIGVSFQNLPPGSTATVEILSLARDHARIAGTYVSDTSIGDLRIDTYDALVPGAYVLTADVTPPGGAQRISLMRDFSVTPGIATLALDKAEYAPGEAIRITFSGMPGDSQDYVATADLGAPNTSYLQYVYLNQANEGTATLTAPTAPGTYELRAFFREDESMLRASVQFTVAGSPVVTIPTPTPEGSAAPLAPAAPSDDARANLVLDQTSYAPGQAITITYSGMSGDQYDYVTTAEAGSANTRYITFVYLRGSLSGTTTLEAPATPGAYEIRAFYREDETILRGSAAFTVTAD
jgi:HEAT repeats